MKYFIGSLLTLLMVVCVSCGSSDGQKKDACDTPSASDCLDTEFCNDCSEKSGDFTDRCKDVLLAHYESEAKSPALVPELDGAEQTERERKNVVHNDQPFLYMPGLTTPSRYSIRALKNGLLTINDGILNGGDHSSGFQALDVEFKPSTDISGLLSQPIINKSKAVTPPFTINPQADYMFEGIDYSNSDIYSLLDSLYVGKNTAWNDNGLKVDSCEEYVFEKFYDFTLFKDFASLHHDDPLRIVEYAYQGMSLDDEGIHYADYYNPPSGAIGSKVLRYGLTSGNVILKKGVAVWPDPDMNLPTIQSDYDKLINAFHGLTFWYPNWPGSKSTIIVDFSHDLDARTLKAHEFYNNYLDGQCEYNNNSVACDGSFSQPDYMPKNFFLEVLGKIDPSNTEAVNGIVLSDNTIRAVYAQPDFASAAVAENEGYVNDWRHHFVMLQMAKNSQPNTVLRKQQLLDFKLLRQHLIALLAERAFWEKKLRTGIIDLPGTPTSRILTQSKTLGLSEKEFAQQRLDDYQAGSTIDNTIGGISIITPPVITSIPLICAGLDRQIEAVLTDAKSKGCLETDRTPALHNYPITDSEDPDSFDFAYDTVFCDWSPEKFSVSAVNVIRDEILDKAYAGCQRTTSGDFEAMNPEAFTFDFPVECENEILFSIWHPGETKDYTQDTSQFRKFEELVAFYPKALSDCDNIIAEKALTDLQGYDMNYYDPVTGDIMMSKSNSYYDSLGGEYAGLEIGYALGWLYEGYETIPGISENDIDARDFVCANTNFFAFGNYFAGGSFLKHDFVLCSAGSYASNKTADGERPDPPTLSKPENTTKINDEIAEAASESSVNTNYFMFIKNEKMTYTYDNGNLTGEEESFSHSQLYSGDTLNYANDPRFDAQMLTINVQQSVPVCGIISITIKGALSGDIDAETYVNGDKSQIYLENRCKSMDFNFTPHLDFDGFAQASATAGLSGVASISAGVDIGLKFVGLRFPYETDLFISRYSSSNNDVDRLFNYDIHSNTFSSLDQELRLLSGFFGAFVKVEYVVGDDTYRQTLFSWDGYKFNGNLSRVGTLVEDEAIPLKIPIRALYTLAKKNE